MVNIIHSHTKFPGFHCSPWFAGYSESLGEADPQFSSPSRIVRFQDEKDKDDTFEQSVAQDRMDSGDTSGLDPALLQAVLADPVLLQAVDPRVLQAVLVSAAAANLAIPSNPLPPPLPPQVTTPVPVFPANPNFQQQSPLKLGQPFNNVPKQGQNRIPEKSQNDFAERPRNNQNNFRKPSPGQLGGSSFNFPESSPSKVNNNFRQPQQQQLGSAFKAVPQQPINNQNNFQPSFRENFNKPQQTNNKQPDKEIEFVVEDFGVNKAEKLQFENQQGLQVELPNLSPPNQLERQVALIGPTEQPSSPRLPLGFTSEELLKTLQENPDVAQQLARQMQKDPSIAKSLGLSFEEPEQPAQPKILANLELPPPTSARQVLPPPGPPGVCSLVTLNGIPCDPGLAFNPATGSCEWPDTLIAAGCNPEGKYNWCSSFLHHIFIFKFKSQLLGF